MTKAEVYIPPEVKAAAEEAFWNDGTVEDLLRAALAEWPGIKIEPPYRDEVLGNVDGYIRLPLIRTEAP